jgi:hypothetical protein
MRLHLGIVAAVLTLRLLGTAHLDSHTAALRPRTRSQFDLPGDARFLRLASAGG